MITSPSMTRAYALGLGYGSVWLVAVCLAFGIFDIVTLTTTVRGTLLSLAGFILVGVALLAMCVRFLHHGYALPKAETVKLSKRDRRIFGGLILLEIIGWTILDITLVRQHQEVWIVPADLLLIGAHFIPLAFVFRVQAYLVMGILWLASIVGSTALWPSTMVIGHASAWYTMPSVCCIGITWLTVLLLLRGEVSRMRAVQSTTVV